MIIIPTIATALLAAVMWLMGSEPHVIATAAFWLVAGYGFGVFMSFDNEPVYAPMDEPQDAGGSKS